VDGGDGARRQHRALHTLLAAGGDEALQVLEIAEVRLVDRRLGPDRQRGADLGDHHADQAGGDLHHRMAGDGVERPELEAQARHQEARLVAGFAVEGDRPLALLAAAEALAHQAHLGRPDGPEAAEEDEDRYDREGVDERLRKPELGEPGKDISHGVAPIGTRREGARTLNVNVAVAETKGQSRGRDRR
jgi:hypothetical protein